MYITCPNCRTSFLVLPEQIGACGRKVKCSRCSTIWYQKPKEVSVTSDSIVTKIKTFATTTPIQGKGINLPALLPTKIPQYLYMLPILLIIAIICLSVVFFQDNILASNNAIAFRIDDVHVENHLEQNKIMILYKILNHTTQAKSIPLIRVRLFDENNKILKMHIADQNVTLEPSQYVHIKTEFSAVLKKAAKVDIALGNKLDFMLW